MNKYNSRKAKEQPDVLSDWCKGTFYSKQYLPHLLKGHTSFLEFIAKYEKRKFTPRDKERATHSDITLSNCSEADNINTSKTLLSVTSCSKDNRTTDFVPGTKDCHTSSSTLTDSEAVKASNTNRIIAVQSTCDNANATNTTDEELGSRQQSLVPNDAVMGDTRSCIASTMYATPRRDNGGADEPKGTQKQRKPQSGSRKNPRRGQHTSLVSPTRSTASFSDSTVPRVSEQGLYTDEVRKQLYFSYAQTSKDNRFTYSLPALLTPFTRSLHRYYTEDEWIARTREKSHLHHYHDMTHDAKLHSSLSQRSGQVDTQLSQHAFGSADTQVTPIAVSANAYPRGPSGPPPFLSTMRRRADRNSL